MRLLTAPLASLCCLVVVAVVGCGGDGGGDDGGGGAGDGEVTEPVASATTDTTAAPDQPAPSDDQADGGDFCAELAGLQRSLDLIDISIGTDWPQTIADMRAAERELVAVQPPSDIADEWTVVAGFFSLIVTAFEGVDLDDQKAVGDVLQDRLGPETEAAAKAAGVAGTRIAAFATDTCGDDTAASPAAAVDDGCALLEDDELRSRVFVINEPTAEPRSFGDGYDECIWTDERSEVSLMLIPLEEFQREYVDKSTPITRSPIDGLEGGLAYDGTVGIARFNTRGHSVSFVAGDRGGFVSVRIGEDGSRSADVGEASRLARLVVSRL